MRLIPKRITDKNGKQNTVHVRPPKLGLGRALPSLSERQRIAAVKELEAAKKRAALHSEIISDLEKNFKPRVNKDGTTTVSVFRSGVPQPPSQRGIESTSYVAAESFKPADGRSGRDRGVFAAPTLGGVARWTLGNNFAGIDDRRVRELRVDIDSTYVYRIRDWEIASSAQRDAEETGTAGSTYIGRDEGYITAEEAHRRYWDGGITLRDWYERIRTDDSMDPSEWEVLTTVEEIQMIKPVSTERTVNGVYENYHVSKKEVESSLNGRSF